MHEHSVKIAGTTLLLSVCALFFVGPVLAQHEEMVAPAAVPTLEKAIAPDRYILGPYDQMLVNLVGPESRNFTLLVLPEGDVFFPGIGTIHADGLTLAEFSRRLEEKVNRYFKNITTYCYLKVPRVFRVFVTGEVNRPGAVNISAFNRVSDAIGKAGGTKDVASARLIRLEREGTVIMIDLVRFLTLGDYERNPLLMSGDRIHVPAGGIHASIYGLVWKPGHYEIILGETVSDLIELAGGFMAEALEDSVMLSRVEGDNIVFTMAVTADQYETMELRDLDEIHTFDGLKTNRRVYVAGAVQRSGRFFLAPGEDLSDLLVRTGRLQDYADLDNVSLERKDGTIIKLNIREYLTPTSPAHFSLEDGDVLHIPAIMGKVSVGGEVQEPGQYPYQNDLTVVQYIGLAGGPTQDGSVNRIVIYSPDGTMRKADSRSYPKRGDVIIVKRAKAKIFGEFFSGLIRLGTVVVTIVVLTK
ncbi:MAG: SLBB domain-containing protein [bacterium]|nr:MAG: SLBB domain-containing protein [bacterium]